MKPDQVVGIYETGCRHVVWLFLKMYFDLAHPINNDDYFWVGGKVGDVLNVGDHWLNMENMVDALRLEVSVDTFFAWYDQWINPSEKEPRYNLEQYNRLTPQT